ncbi:ABC transporter ATP-binding protein [Ancylobacter terrae]|uniref:ABC transporter ATP-binding protein n=1 Tax=Ancylobacter sp. sgz301288 TaxID=3342077 RepID=UPI00385B0031
MAELVISNLEKRFGTFVAVEDFSLHVRDGEFVSLLGPSGCGKSTTLAAIAGLDRPTGGSIRIGAKVCYDGDRKLFLPPEDRGCGLVFQSYALWPHMTVAQNVAFPLKLRKVRGAEQARRIAEVLALVEMESYAGRYPHELSGGQQQRAALARTLVYNPDILLLDEPLSNLDAKLRDRARIWLGELRTKLRMTTIYVTHDQVEALALSDRIVVLNKGRIAQLGTPQEIYENPADPFVADFIGTTNFIRGETLACAMGGGRAIRLDDGQVLEFQADGSAALGERVTFALRPTQMVLLAGGEPPVGGSVLKAAVVSQSYIGGRWQLALDIAGNPVRIDRDDRHDGGIAHIWVPRDGGVVFTGGADAGRALH